MLLDAPGIALENDTNFKILNLEMEPPVYSLRIVIDTYMDTFGG